MVALKGGRKVQDFLHQYSPRGNQSWCVRVLKMACVLTVEGPSGVPFLSVRLGLVGMQLSSIQLSVPNSVPQLPVVCHLSTGTFGQQAELEDG